VTLKITTTPEQDQLIEAAKRSDDPFRHPKFGAVGHWINCRGCGGGFESRGLGACPNCYEVRKAQPGFRDDRRWSSAAGKVRYCEGCGGPLPALTESGERLRADVRFCRAACRGRVAQKGVRKAKTPETPLNVCDTRCTGSSVDFSHDARRRDRANRPEVAA
jgi:hypothetical protein